MKHISRISITSLLLSSLLFTQTSIGELLEIPITQQGKGIQNIKTPRKGISQQSVINNFGRPINTYGPIGQPPINRWDYNNFSVYFEYDRVIHSVLKNKASQ